MAHCDCVQKITERTEYMAHLEVRIRRLHSTTQSAASVSRTSFYSAEKFDGDNHSAFLFSSPTGCYSHCLMFKNNFEQGIPSHLCSSEQRTNSESDNTNRTQSADDSGTLCSSNSWILDDHNTYCSCGGATVNCKIGTASFLRGRHPDGLN